MISTVFYWLFNMSVTASVTGIIVLLVRKIKALPRRVTVFLWIIPFLRMTLPFGVGSKYSLMSFLNSISKQSVTYHLVPGSTSSFDISVTNHAGFSVEYFPVVFKTEPLKGLFGIAGTVWLAGALISVAFITAAYVRTLAGVRGAKRLERGVFVSEKVDSPAVYGIFKPKIVVPVSMEDKELKYILLHEKTHIRKLDNLWRLAALFVTLLHWFNPLAWVFFKRFTADLEFSCDELVASKLNKEERKEYALSLVSEAESRQKFVSAFSGSGLKGRINNLLSYRRITFFSGFCFAAVVAVLAFTLLTNTI